MGTERSIRKKKGEVTNCCVDEKGTNPWEGCLHCSDDALLTQRDYQPFLPR